MNLSPAANRSAARRRLRGLCFGLFIFAAVAGQPARFASAQTGAQAAAAQTITLTLKVCVLDDAGKHVAAQPLLFNSPANRSGVISTKTEDECYASPPINLKTGQPYFIVASDGDMKGLSQFTPAPADKDKLKAINVQLTRQDAAGSADIEVCAKDERGDSLPITGVSPAGDQGQLTKKTPADPSCYRVASAASGEYRLSLVAQGTQSQAPALISSNEFRIVGSLLLFISVLALASGAFLLFRFHTLAPLAARQATVEEIARVVQGLSLRFPSTQGPSINQNTDAPRSPISAGIDDAAPDGGGPGAHVTPEPEPPVPYLTKPAAPAARATTQTSTRRQNSDFDDAKARYRELSGGQQVEHFCLMPSGSSTASGTLEDARIELFEESTGTYVGFNSAAGKGEAFVFPMPNVYFSPDTFKALFPGLSAQDYESGNIEPKVAVNTGLKVWKIQ
jgi:hypothetical protein